jgi:hypothetical protein
VHMVIDAKVNDWVADILQSTTAARNVIGVT